MSGDDYRQARRALRIVMAMRGTTHSGVTNQELAAATGESASNITRMLAVLADEGFIQKLENGRWTHSIALLQIAHSHAEHSARQLERIDEVHQRITRGV